MDLRARETDRRKRLAEGRPSACGMRNGFVALVKVQAPELSPEFCRLKIPGSVNRYTSDKPSTVAIASRSYLRDQLFVQKIAAIGWSVMNSGI